MCDLHNNIEEVNLQKFLKILKLLIISTFCITAIFYITGYFNRDKTTEIKLLIVLLPLYYYIFFIIYINYLSRVLKKSYNGIMVFKIIKYSQYVFFTIWLIFNCYLFIHLTYIDIWNIMNLIFILNTTGLIFSVLFWNKVLNIRYVNI